MTYADSSWFDASAPAGARAVTRQRYLVLASGSDLQYRVLRCAASLKADIHVAGPSRARPLAFSRFCRKFHRVPDFARLSESEAIAAIDAVVRAAGIDLILPADAETTRLLTRVGGRLAAPVFPVPEAGAFDSLATKDRFMRLCARLDIRHPKTRLFDSRAELQAAIAAGEVRYPAIVKPVDRAGGVGVMRLNARTARKLVAKIDYAPILVQDYVPGEDRCISVLCREGEVAKEVVYSHPGGVFHFHDEPELVAIVRGLVRTMKLDGVINFDARKGADGRMHLIECNPRFFYSMDALMIAGVNFVACNNGRPDVLHADGAVRLPRATLRDIFHLMRPGSDDLRMLAHWLGDPLMFAFFATGISKL